jgi:hypothetical protein
VDVPLGSMDVDVTNIHGYPSSAITELLNLTSHIDNMHHVFLQGD